MQKRRLIGRNITVIPLAHLGSPKFETLSSSFVSLVYARCVLRADVAHIHGICSASLTPIAKLLGMKVVVTHHGRDYMRQKWSRSERKFLNAGEWCAVRFSDHVIAVSPTIARYLQQRYPGVNATFIPNGADHVRRVSSTSPDATRLTSRFGVGPGDYVISVGRLDPDKGFDDLIDAFLQSQALGKLLIVGDDPRNTYYSKHLLTRASDRVVFTGYLPMSDVGALLSSASLFVLPSHQEGFPIAALEAALIGTPLIVSDIPATRDLALEERHYFPVGDVKILARMLGEEHSTYAIGDNRLLRQFRWGSVASMTASVYHQVVGSQPRRSAVPAR
jgi:glycosyltransferase involved in cell wall biosynthesis